ncbi:MAG TPA: EamA family transporter [Casimicrobiaceae bacterium]|nr:EamA family transporter [Casimicrobiaceae bacterium]
MELTFGITLAVLGAGLLHAGWNALLKSAPGGDALLDTATVVAGSSLWGFAVVPFVGVPASAAWPYMAASAVIHFGYYLTLAQAYRTGDLSFAYPLMRGSAPLIVALLGIVFLGELPTAPMALGIVLISLGIVSIAFVGAGRGGMRRHPPSAAYWAFANAGLIALYTLIDATGARASGNAAAYVSWLIFLEGLPFLFWVFVRRGKAAWNYVRASAPRGLVGGACSLAAYGIVLWAMTRAPVAAVAALRETSVLFAALIGSLWLKEGFGLPRLAGAASVVAGIAALKLG